MFNIKQGDFLIMLTIFVFQHNNPNTLFILRSHGVEMLAVLPLDVSRHRKGVEFLVDVDMGGHVEDDVVGDPLAAAGGDDDKTVKEVADPLLGDRVGILIIYHYGKIGFQVVGAQAYVVELDRRSDEDLEGGRAVHLELCPALFAGGRRFGGLRFFFVDRHEEVREFIHDSRSQVSHLLNII